MIVNRRTFISQAAIAAGGVGVGNQFEAVASPESEARRTEAFPLIVSTWPFGQASNEKALEVIGEGGSILDGVEQGIHVTEADLKNVSVGVGGIPNADGVVQLDSCIMNGPGHQAGSVAALEDVMHPISVARRVMEKTPHVMLAGAGAKAFAIKEGIGPDQMLTEERRKAWQKWKTEQAKKKPGDGSSTGSESPENHDTIALMILGADGNIAGGCSTSGWGYKLPGRVGDSPIIGSGLYVDNEVGAAGATGLGENVMRYCASYQVVEFMRQGMSPEEACIAVIKRIAKHDPLGINLSINFVALDKKGNYGAAGTGNGFTYAVTTPKVSGVLRSAALSGVDTGPIGGNRF